MRSFHVMILAALIVLATPASEAAVFYTLTPSPAAPGARVSMHGASANMSSRITLTNLATHATFATGVVAASVGVVTFDVPSHVPDGIYRVFAYDARGTLLGMATVSIRGTAPANATTIEGQWYGLKDSPDGNPMNAGRLVFVPKKTPVPAGAKLPELVFPARGLTGNIKRVVCKIGIPAFPSDPSAGYWAPNPFGEPSFVWVIHQSRYPQYLAPTSYPTAPAPAPSKNTMCVPEGDTRVAPSAR